VLDAGRAARDPESAISAGAREYLIEEPMAAAIGADLRWRKRPGRWWSTSAAATESGISLGGMVYSGSVRVGGGKFDGRSSTIRRNYGMLIGESPPR
jgi:rod shape-determining protein MreB